MPTPPVRPGAGAGRRGGTAAVRSAGRHPGTPAAGRGAATTIAGLAAELGVHQNTVREHLDAFEGTIDFIFHSGYCSKY